MLIENQKQEKSEFELMQDFFNLINLNCPGLEDLKDAVENDNYDLAAEKLLSYMRKRKKPLFYQGWDRHQRNENYDTTEADKVVKRHLVHLDLGDDIDWKMDPHGDPEWKYCLNRHEYLTTLGRAYWFTGNEKYTKAFKELISDWIDKNPMPELDWMLEIPKEQSRNYFMQQGTWRPLTIGIRLYTAWCPCYFHFLESPLLTPEFHIKMLNSMAEHAKHLRWYYTRHVNFFNVSPNWGLMESNGLAHMGILFPEFKKAHDWQNTALSRLEEQVRLQVLPDGTHIERCSGYHLVSTFCLLQIAELALRNNIKISSTWLTNLEKMIDYVLYLLKPHGVYPALSDGDESDVIGNRASYGLWEDINNLNMLEDSNDLRYVLKAGARLFDRPDMFYAATLGKKGSCPSKNSVSFPDGGFFITRSGWNKDDLYMAINCGPMGAYDQSCVHAHADALSVDVSAFGKNMIIDPGRYMYEGPYRIWFKGTRAHNTIVVDDQDQSKLKDEWLFENMAETKNHKWISSDNFDYFSGSHNGYERLDKPVNHKRRILFIKPFYWVVLDEMAAEGEHDYDIYWHFTEQAKVDVNHSDLKAIVDFGDDVFLSVTPVGSELNFDIQKGSQDPIQGWVSYDYAVKKPAPALQYSQKAKGSVKFITILTPYKNTSVPMKVQWDNTISTLTIQRPDVKELVIFADQDNDRYGKFEFDGEMLYSKFDHNDKLGKCYSADSSYIIYNSKEIFDGSMRVKQDDVELNL